MGNKLVFYKFKKKEGKGNFLQNNDNNRKNLSNNDDDR